MQARLEKGIEAIQEARKQGLKHVSLTDPDARMMGEGRTRRITECHSYEVAMDNGVLVVGQPTQNGNDNDRLLPLVEAAQKTLAGVEPAVPVTEVDGDSGYFSSEAVAALEQQGLHTCIPDAWTAADLHHGNPIGTARQTRQGTVSFEYDAQADHYTCPQGNILRYNSASKHHGQQVRVYKAKNSCAECPLAKACLQQKTANYRTLKVGVDSGLLQKLRERFQDTAHQDRYNQRGPAVETVFGFLRGTLGYTRWQLRTTPKVACEAVLWNLAYQFRKVHFAWRQA